MTIISFIVLLSSSPKAHLQPNAVSTEAETVETLRRLHMTTPVQYSCCIETMPAEPRPIRSCSIRNCLTSTSCLLPSQLFNQRDHGPAGMYSPNQSQVLAMYQIHQTPVCHAQECKSGQTYHQLRSHSPAPQFSHARTSLIASQLRLDRATSLRLQDLALAFLCKPGPPFKNARTCCLPMLTTLVYDWQVLRTVWPMCHFGSMVIAALPLCYLRCGTRRLPRGK